MDPRQTLVEISEIIAGRIDADRSDRPSAAQALYMIDRITRRALRSDAGFDSASRDDMPLSA